MSVSRRGLLQGAALGGAVGAVWAPGEARAASDRVRAHVQELRLQRAILRQQYLDGVYDDRPASADRPFTAHIHALANGFGAVAAIKRLQELPVEEQAHPEAQALIAECAEDVGESAMRGRELLEAYVASDQPGRETHLRAALRGVRLSIGDYVSRPAHRHLAEGPVEAIEKDGRPGALLRKVERLIERTRKVERLAREVEARGELSALPEEDPDTLARVDAALGHWGAADRLGACATRNTGKLIAGILVLSIGCAFGVILLLSGLCVVACGASTGFLVMLVGAAIIGLSLWIGLELIQQGRGAASREPAEVPERFTRRDVREVPILGEDGWVETGVERADGGAIVVRGSGLVRMRGGWMADADGNGEAGGEDALVPGAPIGALVGRVGDDRFFLGSEGIVPEGPPGAVWLAVNRQAHMAAKGHLVAEVTVYGSDVV